MKLSEIQCKHAKPAEKPYRLTDGHGMYLEVMPNGSKYWRLKYRFADKEKRLALGVYPRVSLKDARKKREEARLLLDDGIDPGLDKKKKKLQVRQNAANTFELLAKEWLEQQKAVLSPKHHKTLENRMIRDIYPFIGNMPISEVTPQFILEVVRKVEDRGAYDVARRIKQTCGQIFRYGVATGRAERDPTGDIKEALRPYRPEHYPTLDIKEIPAFLDALDANEANLTKQTRLAMRFLMLTFVRTSEMINARWAEFDLEEGTWLIPAKRMKMRRDHIVPLSKQTTEILKELKKSTGHMEHVFPNQANPRKVMSNATITRALMRMGYKGKMSGHGFRALAMTTIKEKLGYRHEAVDRQLAHAHKNKIVAAYDRAEFLDDRRKMMQEYADYIDEIVEKAKTGEERPRLRIAK